MTMGRVTVNFISLREDEEKQHGCYIEHRITQPMEIY